MRDERAELQNSNPGRARSRTPGPGISGTPGAIDTGPTPRMDASEISQPVDRIDGNDLSGPVVRAPEAADAGGAMDPPVRPIHPVDEVTPPAADVTDLRHEEKPS
jgi:hypothetical protein